MKKILTFLIICLTLCSVGLIACDKQEHSHTYSSEWSFDKTHHWHASTCDCDEKSEYGEHSFVDDVCSTCNINYLQVAFDSGCGTETDPYIISTTEELENIAKVNTFSYFKVKDGVEELDLSNWTSIRLNGCFDGNNVKLVNLNTRLFTHVGYNEEKEIYVKNFEVTINLVSSSHAALIKEIDNFGTTVFENLKIHGYIEGESNMASLFSFGTNNGHSTGSNYTVELKNVNVDATLVCTTAQPFAGFVAHAYAGTGNKLTLNVDNQTQFTGEVYSAGTKTFNEYIAIGTYEINKQGEPFTQNTKISTKSINKIVPVLGKDGYIITADENVSLITASITGQISAYDNEGNPIATKSGITMTFKTKKITENLQGDIKILDVFNSAEIINGSNEYNAEIVDGVLKIYVAQSVNYASGTLRLQVQQYNSQGEIISCGTLNIYTISK